MKKIIVISLLLFTSHLYSNDRIQPSFDCSKAKTRVEKLVCSDEDISRVDRDMQKAYDLMMGKYDIPYMNEEAKEEIKPYLEKLKQSQIDWVKYRDKYCNTKKDEKEFNSCVFSRYVYRIESIVPSYDWRTGFSINDKNSTNDLCYNYFTQKFWMDSPKPVNKDNPPYGEDKEFYEKFLIDALDDVAKRELNTTKNYYYTQLDGAPVGSNIMCVGIGGEEKEIYDLRSKTYKPYCTNSSMQFEDFLNGEYIKPGKKPESGLKFKEVEETKEEFKKRGLDYEKDDNFSTEVYKKVMKNGFGRFSNAIYNTNDKSYDANILSDGMVRILYASNLEWEKSKEKFGVYKYSNGYSDSPAFIVADKFFFRVYMSKYGNYLVCRMPIQSRFKDRNDTKLIREYLNQFKEF